MATINFNWLLASMKGKACSHDDVYTKTNTQTGRSYAVKLCNPVDGSKASEKQKKQRNKFGNIAQAISAWISTEKVANSGTGSVEYLTALSAYKSQHKIGSLRGFIMKKYVAYDDATGKVTITVAGKSSSVNPNTNANANPNTNQGGGGTTPGGEGGLGDDF